MPRAKRVIGDEDFVWVRSIYGKGADASQRYHYIPEGGMNKVLADWHSKQPERPYTCATPSRMMQCPRAVWLHNHGVERLNTMGWGTAQRMMLGRQLEDLFAKQLRDEGILAFHWKDNDGDVVDKFSMGTGDDRLEGVPDYLLNLDLPTISDAKTSRSDSFGYTPITMPEIWEDYQWYKYKVQVDGYYMLCLNNVDWFTAEGLPLPEQCHLFSYALDDGIVRREFTWKTTEEDMENVRFYVRRFNQAITASDMPDCTCKESLGGGEVKFCPYGTYDKSTDKVCSDCCSDDLINQVKENING